VRKQTLPTDAAELRTQTAVPAALRLTEKERDRLLRIVERVGSLKTHYELFLLAQGEVQDFLPHRVLISVWGDFATGDLGLDILSAESALRTEGMGGRAIHGMVESSSRRTACNVFPSDTRYQERAGWDRESVFDAESAIEHHRGKFCAAATNGRIAHPPDRFGVP